MTTNAQAVLGAIGALGFAMLPACQSSGPGDGEWLDAPHHLHQIRAAFQIAQVPDGGRVPVIGDSIATGYAQIGSALQLTNPAATEVELALLPACQTSGAGGGEWLVATPHLDQIRAAFQIAQVPDGGRVPVIGDSIATGYAQIGSALQLTHPAATQDELALPSRADRG